MIKPRLKKAGDIYNELLKAGWEPENATLFLNNIPDASDVAPVVRGRWIHDYNNVYGCSECLGRESMSPKRLKPFCPSCGAKMEG